MTLEGTFRARVIGRLGRLRWLPIGLGILLLIASVGLKLVVVAPATVLFGLGIVLALGMRLVPTRTSRTATIACGAGEVRLGSLGRGPFHAGSFTVRAKDLTGATSSRGQDGYRITLGVRTSPYPITLEVKTLGELARIRRALGIGARGYGTISFPTRPSAANVVETIASLAAVVLVPWVVVATLLDLEPNPSTLLDLAAFIAAGAAFLRWAGASGRRVKLDAMSIVDATDGTTAHYVSIPKVVDFPEGLATGRMMIRTRSVPLVAEGMTTEERAIFASLLRDAVTRAHGEAVPIADFGHVTTMLERRENEPISSWLARLDAISVGTSGYRGVTLPEDELVAILEDSDQPPALRAAAARVLAKNEVTRVRVAEAVAAEHDERVRVRIDAASEGRDAELAELVAEDEAAKRRMIR